MDVERLAIPDVLVITPKRHEDARGYFMEVWNERTFAGAGLALSFVQDNQSLSRRAGTVRGLHFQIPPFAQGKLVRVLTGAIRDVAVDLRKGSPTYGHHVHADLSAEDGRMIWVPEGFAHGFCTLTDDTEVAYKVTAFYDRESDKGLAFDDPALSIDWGMPPDRLILSEKDRRHPTLAELPDHFA